MDITAFRDYCLRKKGTVEAFPFDEATLVFKVMGKMFALLPLDEDTPRANLKCDPERAVELREQWPEAILPGWHMNKKHWNTICIEALPDRLVCELIDHSRELVVAGLSRKQRQQLDELP